MAEFRTLDDLTDATGKTVLVRVDFNVPLADGRVTDATRIERTLPTIEQLRNKGAKVVLMTHMGRPKGQVDPQYSVEQLVPELDKRLGTVKFASDCVGEEASSAVAALAQGDVLILENLRFHKEEEKNGGDFVAALAALGDIYVNDAFATAHRAHASTEGLAHHLPAFAGRTMEAELNALGAALSAPKRPVAAVVGGAKVSSKLDLLNNLIKKVDHLIIGGGMANTFLAAQGKRVGASLCEHDLTETATSIMAAADAEKCEIVLPEDVVVAPEFKAHSPSRVVPNDQVQDADMILDVGPAAVEKIGAVVAQCKTFLWNGPLGAFELEPFDKGTVAAAQIVAEATQAGSLTSVAGGGDTVSALNHAGVADHFSYVSTAGGAFLEWIEGKELPGVAALSAQA